MLPCNPGGHAAYQDTFVFDFLIVYPDPFVLPKSTWDYIAQFWYLDLSQTDSMILSRLVDTFSSRILHPMLLLSGNQSIAVVLSWEEGLH